MAGFPCPTLDKAPETASIITAWLFRNELRSQRRGRIAGQHQGIRGSDRLWRMTAIYLRVCQSRRSGNAPAISRFPELEQSACSAGSHNSDKGTLDRGAIEEDSRHHPALPVVWAE